MTASIGDSLKPFRIESVNAESMKTWARVLHDPNPIHLDPAAVRAKGWGDRVINQGPANLATIISMLQASLPGMQLESLDVRYVDNVFAGDAVEAGGSITQVSDGGARLVCEVWLRADARATVISGTAVLCLALTGG